MKTERNILLKVAIICAVVIIVMICAKTVAYANGFPVDSVAIVCADTKLNIRERPQGKIIGGIPKGETVTILSEIDRNGYYFIRVNKTGQECYTYGEFLALVQLPETNTPNFTNEEEREHYDTTYSEWENATLVVISDKQLNMRKKPTRKADRIKYLEFGNRLQVVSPKIKNNYILVKDLAEGKVGYVNIDYVVLEGNQNFETITQENYFKCICENCCCGCR